MSTDGGTPGVSVLLVNWNTAELIERCLTSLRDADNAGELEVIVVDNGSSDGSVAMIREKFPEVRLIANTENVGFTAATNQAFAASRAPFVLMLNSDTVVERDVIRKTREYLEAHNDIAAVGCRILNPDGTVQPSCMRYPSLLTAAAKASWISNAFPSSPALNRERYGEQAFDRPVDVDAVMGSYILIRRDALTTPTLLDDGYWMYAEEMDLCRRLTRAGWRVVYYPLGSVTHERGASTKTARQRAWSEQAKRRAELRFIWSWRGRTTAYLANLLMLLGLVPRAVAWAVQDFRASLRAGRPTRDALLRADVYRFHLAALKDPDIIASSWGPPS